MLPLQPTVIAHYRAGDLRQIHSLIVMVVRRKQIFYKYLTSRSSSAPPITRENYGNCYHCNRHGHLKEWNFATNASHLSQQLCYTCILHRQQPGWAKSGKAELYPSMSASSQSSISGDTGKTSTTSTNNPAFNGYAPPPRVSPNDVCTIQGRYS